MSAQADQQAAAFNQRLQSDPAFRKRVADLTQQLYFNENGKRGGNSLQLFKDAQAQLSALGIPQGWMTTKQGDLVRDHSLRNAVIEGAAFAGTAGLYGALAAPAAAGASAGTAGTTAGTTAATTAATTAPSTIATTAGMSPFTKALISAGVSLGTNVLNGYLQNRAIGKAADQQTAALEKAQAINEQTRKENIARVQPWVNTGLGANSTLANLFGLASPGGTSGDAPSSAAPSTPSAPAMDPSKSGGVNPNPPAQTPPGASGGMTLANLAQSTPQQVAEQQTQSGYVRMRAPNGDEEDVPANLVQHYKDLKAVPIGAM